MKKANLFVLSLLLCTGSLFSQGPTFNSSSLIGSDHGATVKSIATDIWGNYIIAGSFSDTIDLDPGVGVTNLISLAGSDFFIAKYNASNELEWARSLEGKGNENFILIETDPWGHVYITGAVGDTIDFDPGPGVVEEYIEEYGYFILKLNSDGNYSWSHFIETRVYGSSQAIAIDDNPDIYITGSFEDTVDFDPSVGMFELISEGSEDMYIQKLDSAGNFIWAKSVGSVNLDVGNDIHIDNSGNVLVTGIYGEDADFDPGAGTDIKPHTGFEDMYILKLDNLGEYVWAYTLNDLDDVTGIALTTDDDGNIYQTGRFSGTVDFDPGPMNNYKMAGGSSTDVFIQKIDAQGNFTWVRTFGNDYSENVYSIAIDEEKNSYVIGSFMSTINFGGSSVQSVGSNDGYLYEIDSNGYFVWAGVIGGKKWDYGRDLLINHDDQLLITGYYSDSADFYIGYDTISFEMLGSNNNLFVCQLSKCETQYIDFTFSQLPYIIENCTADTPDIPTATTSCGKEIEGVPDVTFPITAVDTTIVTWTYDDGNGFVETQEQTIIIEGYEVELTRDGNTLRANMSGALYRWLDCNNDYAVIPGATSQTYFTLTEGSYAVEATYFECIDTSDCYAFSDIDYKHINPNIEVFPNPTNGEINILFNKQHKNVTLILKSITGQVLSEKLYNSVKNINYNINQNDGIYLLEIRTDNDIISIQKITKQ